MNKSLGSEQQKNFITNVMYLIKQNGKLSDFEEVIGCSPGYLSRLLKRSGGIPLNIALVAADYVGKPIEELCTGNLRKELELEYVKTELELLERRKRDLMERLGDKNGN